MLPRARQTKVNPWLDARVFLTQLDSCWLGTETPSIPPLFLWIGAIYNKRIEAEKGARFALKHVQLFIFNSLDYYRRVCLYNE